VDGGTTDNVIASSIQGFAYDRHIKEYSEKTEEAEEFMTSSWPF
jgi:hypothetical protein